VSEWWSLKEDSAIGLCSTLDCGLGTLTAVGARLDLSRAHGECGVVWFGCGSGVKLGSEELGWLREGAETCKMLETIVGNHLEILYCLYTNL
jgi:hypothetical protein